MKEVVEELRNINIYPSGKINGISPNSRAKCRLGCCKKIVNKGRIEFEIEISTMMDRETDQAIKEIIHHELLHTCKGCLNHGQKWKALAAEVNRVYGYNIRSTAEAKYLHREEAKDRYKYEIRCTQCGNTAYRMRKSKVVSHPGNYRCSKCGGALVVREKRFWI